MEVGACSQNSLNNFSFLTAFGYEPARERHLDGSHLHAGDSTFSPHTQNFLSISHQAAPGTKHSAQERERKLVLYLVASSQARETLA